VHFSIRSVSLCPDRRRRVIFEKAKTVLSRFRAVSKSCASTVTGVSGVPAVSEPSKSMSVPWLWLVTLVWSHLSSSVVMRVCMWIMLGTLVWLFSFVSKLYWWKSWLISVLFSSVMWNGKGPMRKYW